MSVVTGAIKVVSSIVDTLAAGATRPASVSVSLALDHSNTFTDGVTANKFNKCYYFSGSAAATPTVINLSTIVCTDGTVGMTHVRAIIAANDNTTDGQTLIFGGGTTPFQPDLAGTTPTETIHPGSAKILVYKPLGTTGHAVSTNVNLKFDPTAATVAFRVWVFGHGT
jgi:hypothetical protein